MYNAIKNKEKKGFYLRKIRKFIGLMQKYSKTCLD